jgi:hypothetical protein
MRSPRLTNRCHALSEAQATVVSLGGGGLDAFATCTRARNPTNAHSAQSAAPERDHRRLGLAQRVAHPAIRVVGGPPSDGATRMTDDTDA